MLLPSQKPSSSYSLLKFVYVIDQLRHPLVLHPLPRKILDPPLRTLARGLFSAAIESWLYNVLDIPGVAMIFRTGGWHCCTPRVLARLGAWGQRQALRLCPEKNWRVPWICVIQGIQHMISNYEKFLESDFLVTEEEKLDARGHWALLKHIHEAAK